MTQQAQWQRWTAALAGRMRHWLRRFSPSRVDPDMLADVFEKIRPTIVAFGSRVVTTAPGGRPRFPEIIGTGFIVDSRGIAVTNAHVIEALTKLQKHPTRPESPALAILTTEVERKDGRHYMGTLFTSIVGYNLIQSFVPEGPFYGERLPDFGFVQLRARDLPVLPLADEANLLRVGVEIATAGFPLGTDALTPFEGISQLTPFLRHGIISSVLPFPCPYPHGFTIDIMSQGGASGSPIFLRNEPKAVGILHAGFSGANITYAVPSHIVAKGMAAALEADPPRLDGVPTLSELIATSERSSELSWESIGIRKAEP
jgi:S1-C subfamily serine protease